jgi:hypothetical protein
MSLHRTRWALLSLTAVALMALGASPAGAAPGMAMSSRAMPDGSTVGTAQLGSMHLPVIGLGCDGQDRSPDLSWRGGPARTRSYAVVMVDPDLPIPNGIGHWAAFDIAPTVTSLPEGLPAHTPLARQANNTIRHLGYSGPCAPPGPPHHYVVTVHALDVASLGLPDGTDIDAVRAAVDRHTISSATLTATFALGLPHLSAGATRR